MNKIAKTLLKYKLDFFKYRGISTNSLPSAVDVVIIGGGSQGCNTLYQLSKRGCKAILLERSKLTCGTTWHTAGLVWRLRPNDVEIQLLKTTRDTLISLKDTYEDSGWLMNGGLFIAHSKERINEYKRLATLGKTLNIESHVLTPEETIKVFPLLDPTAFTHSLYSPGDGVVDPSLMCTALTKASAEYGNNYYENCEVTDLLVETNYLGEKCIQGVVTPYGTIKTNCVVNATGVWGRDLVEKHGIHLPLIPMKHAYIVTSQIKGAAGLPNVRDHDYSIYFRMQGESICMGGYEPNPVILDNVANNFEFSLYDLDWSCFDSHFKGASKLCPAFEATGIKSNICGPESFTPDHKPLLGPDPRLDGLFHNCGFNSAGMMLGGGCGEVIAEWILKGRPHLHMFAYDIRRFYPDQTKNLQWARERSHEAYAKNYNIVFPHDEPLAGRNFYCDPFHDQMVADGAVMEEKHGFERPGIFLKNGKTKVNAYDWYGEYDNKLNSDQSYVNLLKTDYTFSFSKHHELIQEEALACRNNVALFNLSYFGKTFLTGPDAKEAASWLFTANTNIAQDNIVYTLSLNDSGGVEADVTVAHISSGLGHLHDPIFKGSGYYIIAGGASAYHTFCHLKEGLKQTNYKAMLTNVTHSIGVLSIQGKNSREILQDLTDFDLCDENMPPRTTKTITINVGKNEKKPVRILRISFVGELGYELHISKDDCADVYDAVKKIASKAGLRNGGYRSLYSLSSEKGYHLWGTDLRSDDTPLEANLLFTCRKTGGYRGKEKVDVQRKEGSSKRMVYFTLDDNVPLWGLETIYRNGTVVGHLRRGDFAYYLQKPFGQGYIVHPEKNVVDNEFITSGNYEIEIMGKTYKANCHLRSPFDPQNKRINGNYEE